MTQVNLLPTEIRQRQRQRQATTLAALAVIAIVAVLIGVFFLEGTRLSSAKQDLATQQAKNAQLQQQIGGLQRFATLAQQASAKQQVIDQLTKQVVPWSSVLRDVSSVIPSNVYVTGVAGSVTIAASSVGPAANANGIIGTLQIQGFGVNPPAVALWLSRVSPVHGWANPWVSTASRQTSGIFQWSGTIDLSSKAAIRGGRQ